MPGLLHFALVATALFCSAIDGSAQESGDLGKLSIEELKARIDREQRQSSDTAGGQSLVKKRLMQEAISRGGKRPIYGTDDRADWYEINDPPIKRRALATVALFRSSSLQKSSSGVSYDLKARSLGAIQKLCPGETFSSQLAGAFCSGILVAPDTVVTAGHCIQEISRDPTRSPPLASEIRFVFGYYASRANDPGPLSFHGRQVFQAATIIDGTWEAVEAGGEDWAVVRLDRPVPHEIAEPVKLVRSSRIPDGAPVYVIGYPSGLPLKYAPNASVRTNTSRAYFIANLDTFGGNSGSGVFIHDSNELAGILVRGEHDYFLDEDQNCYRTFVCPTTGCGGEEVTRIELVKGLR